MAYSLIRPCTIAGFSIRCRGTENNEFLCLTDLYRAANRPSNKAPSQWARLPDTKEFITFQCKTLNVGESHIIVSERGRSGGTWGHWVIAIKYAAYLSKQLEDELIRSWRQIKEEERNPELAADRTLQRMKNYYVKQKGYPEEEAEKLAAQRLISKANRNLLTSEWKGRGAKQPHYPRLTNAGYVGLFNRTAGEMRQEQDLPRGCNLRDHLPLDKLAQTSLHEVLTRERLQQDGVDDVNDMTDVSLGVGKQIAQAVTAIRSHGHREETEAILRGDGALFARVASALA
jgi:hypothetical protein